MQVLWAPTRVGEGRRIRVVVECTDELTCEHNSTLRLLDRGISADDPHEHRFYLLAKSPAEIAVIRFSGDGETVETSLRIIAERDWDRDETVGQIELPRTWPLDRREIGLKTRHTIFPAEQIGKGESTGCDEASWSDQKMWDQILPCDIPRWHFLNLDEGCPIHGHEIYHTDPYYPWIVDPVERPYHVQCPVGKEWLPTNDYASGDHTSGDYPDDGFGFDRDGAKFGLMAYSLLRRIRNSYIILSKLSDEFGATGDRAVAHRIAILLAAFAREHRYLCYFPEHRFRRYEGTVEEEQYREYKGPVMFGPLETTRVEHLAKSGMDEYMINMPGQYRILMKAYDLVFDLIEDDADLVAFVSERMPWIRTGTEVRAFIERYLLHAGAQGALDDTIASNLPEPQHGMLEIIRTIDQPECAELGEWLVHGGGQVAGMPRNFYYKDGAAYESTGGYNGHHVSALVPIAEGLRALCDADPETWPPERFDVIAGSERYHHIFRWPAEVVIAQTTHPLIGDTGGIPVARVEGPNPIMDVSNALKTYESAVRAFPDDAMLGRILEMLKAKANVEQKETGKAGFYDKPAEAQVEYDPDIFLPSRLLDGYGVGILESGEGESRRGFWLYYGDHPGHAHEQVMDMGLVALRRNLLRHMGYPYSWQFMGTWDANWITHYGVKVVTDQNLTWKNTVRLFHGHGAFQVVEAAGLGISTDGGPSGYEEVPGYAMRRTLALVDLPDGRFYCVDLFGVEGGDDHWWVFHGPDGDLTESPTSTLNPQPTGTAAGPDVEYGEEPPDGIPHSLAHLYDVRRGEAGDAWSAKWDVKDGDGLSLRITQVGPDDGELLLARGRSPHAPADKPPYELDWLLRHRSGDGLKSEFAGIIETGTDLPVRSSERFDADGFLGLRVELDGLTHFIIRRTAPGAAFDRDGIVFDGDAGFVEVDTNTRGIRRMTLVGGGMLTLNGVGITRGSNDWSGVVGRVDGNDIYVASEEAPSAQTVGRYLLVNRPRAGWPAGDTFAYRIEAVEADSPGVWRCRSAWSTIIGGGTAGEKTELGFMTSDRHPLGRSRTYYRGSYLFPTDETECVRLAHVDDNGSWEQATCEIVIEEGSRDRLGLLVPEGREFTINEIAPGNRASFGGWTEIVISSEDGARVTSSSVSRVETAGL